MNTEAIGDTIKQRRIQLAVDQKSLSEICGISVHALSNIESGKGNPTITSLNLVLGALGMELQVHVSTGGRSEGTGDDVSGK
jgi:transcriptional regulator with XRE-family HTH domain